MKRLLPILCCIASSVVSHASVLDSLFSVYEKEISRSHLYIEDRQHSIDSLKSIDCANEAAVLLQIGELYRPLQSDSAVVYFSRVISYEGRESIEARIRLILLFASSGLYDSGIAVARDIENVPDDLKIDWYDAMIRLYRGAGDNNKMQFIKSQYYAIAEQYQDSISTYGSSTDLYHSNIYNYYISKACHMGDYEAAIAISDSIAQYTLVDSHDYAIWAYRRANIYQMSKQEELYEEWLIRSALADVRSGVTDNGASWLVANIAYHKGRLESASSIIQYSLNNAAIFNAPVRYIQTNSIGNIINRSYQQQQRIFSHRLEFALALSVLLAVMLCILLLYTLHQYRRMHMYADKLSMLNSQLKESNTVKEQFICKYLEVYSEYIQRLTKMSRKAGNKDSQQFLEVEMEKFYNSFDTTFLSLYGNFIADFNALLLPEAYIVPKPGELMTTELRIFALIRLGISSSSKIAALLCYSPNTIANYRVRVKNNARVNRDKFEDYVKKIGLNEE